MASACDLARPPSRPTSADHRNTAPPAGLDLIPPAGSAHFVARPMSRRWFFHPSTRPADTMPRAARRRAPLARLVLPSIRSPFPMRRTVLTLCLPVVMVILASSGEGAAPPPKAPPPAMPKSLSELRALEAKIQKTLEKIVPATVGVGGGGSGVVVSKDGLIVCVAHVTQKAGREVQITFPDGKRAKSKTLGNYKSADASLLQIVDKGPWPYADMGKSSDVRPGQWALAVGYPVSFGRGQKPPVRIGRVLRQSSTSVVTDCPIMGGDSGGPLFDLEGRLIGCNSSAGGSMSPGGSVPGNVHVAIDVYHSNWKRLNDGEDWGEPRTGRPKRSSTAVPMPDAPSTLVRQKGFRQSSQYERNNEVVREAFREAVEPVAKSTVRVLIDGKPAMLGTVVSDDG